jgi:hypothetical protein
MQLQPPKENPVNLKTSMTHPDYGKNARLQIIDDDDGKVVGHVRCVGVDNYLWEIDGCGGYASDPEDALHQAQQLTARRQAETEELERQSKADSGDYVAGLMSTLRRVSEELTAEYYRKARRPASIAQHEAELDKIKTQLANNPIRFRGYSITPCDDGWTVTSPISAADSFSAPSLAKALFDINEALGG